MNDGFQNWLDQCRTVALRSEWEIDDGLPEWKMWFEQNLTPGEAVQKLWELIMEEAK